MELMDKYNDKDGVEKYDTHVRANTMQMLGGKPEGERGGTPARGRRPERQDEERNPPSDGIEDDKIPFATNRGTY